MIAIRKHYLDMFLVRELKTVDVHNHVTERSMLNGRHKVTFGLSMSNYQHCLYIFNIRTLVINKHMLDFCVLRRFSAHRKTKCSPKYSGDKNILSFCFLLENLKIKIVILCCECICADK